MDIQSTSNEKVKQWSKLLGKKGRQKQQKFLIEGAASVTEAIQAGAELDSVVYLAGEELPIELSSRLKGVKTYAVHESVLKKCTDAAAPQSVFAVAHMKNDGLPSNLSEHVPYILCDGIQDPGNLGTIIRSADAAGAAGVIMGPDCVDLYNPKVVRSTMGSMFHLPVITHDLIPLIKDAKVQGINVWVTSPRASVSCYEADFTKPSWFVIGNEARGVSDQILDLISDRLYIPMRGKAESLNAAMAATVLLFESLRQNS